MNLSLLAHLEMTNIVGLNGEKITIPSEIGKLTNLGEFKHKLFHVDCNIIR